MDTPLLSSSSIGSSSSSTSSQSVSLEIHSDNSRKYDVFINFRASEDSILKDFMARLRAALSEKGIKTFEDEEEEEEEEDDMIKGGRVVEGIENSSCSIVVFSPSYARSSRCLDELVKIRDCVKTRGHSVVPVFFVVDPTHVRKRLGSFHEAFSKHEKGVLVDSLERVYGWKVALVEITSLSGLDLQNHSDEEQFIKEIVAEVSAKLESVTPSKAPEYHDRFNIGKFLFSGNYGITSALGFVGALCVFFLVVFPLFGALVFVVSPNAAEQHASEMMRVPKSLFKHYWPN